MTEYDYSPAAYQRHMETQNRIARWVDNTEAHHDIFRTPFGPRSDVGDDDLDGMSDADEAIPSGASAGGWYEEKRRSGARTGGLPPPLPMLHQPQPMMAPNAMYPAALASAPVGHYPYPPQVYMSPPASPSGIIIQTSSRHHHRSSSHRRHSSHKSRSKPKMYILSPPGSAVPPMSPYGYPSASVPPPPGSFYHQPYSAYAAPPPQTHSGQSLMSSPPSPYYQAPHSAGYMVVPPNGAQFTRVMYV